MSVCTIKVLPEGRVFTVKAGVNLRKALLDQDVGVESPCGGTGTCGKCRVTCFTGAGRKELLACQYVVTGDMIITRMKTDTAQILTEGSGAQTETDEAITGLLAAVDIGTTTVVCYLLDADGAELAVTSMLNPQRPYGGDVVTRIREALDGRMETLTALIRDGVSRLLMEACAKAGKNRTEIEKISLVGNPCMQQLFLGISPENLARPPFSPVLRTGKWISAEAYLPAFSQAMLLVVPDISGYVGADTVACVLATRVYEYIAPFLLVDIGTNGEMVMGNGRRMVACSTAAGPALEGAGIRFGMRGEPGAIDHVTWEGGTLRVHTIGEIPARGICGSGLIDAAAVLLRTKAINFRGRLATAGERPELAAWLDVEGGERVFRLTEKLFLTQSDVRQLQLTKGAVGAGTVLLAQYLGIELSDIEEVILAGAFGSYLRPDSACDIGLLPPVLRSKIRVAGNAAGAGARRLVCSDRERRQVDEILRRIEFLELASLPEFQSRFAREINFARI